jgi:hypothetical protein
MLRRLIIWFKSLGNSTIPMILFLICLILIFLFIVFEKLLVLYFSKSQLADFLIFTMCSMGGFLGLIWITGDDESQSFIIQGVYRIISGWTLLLLAIYLIISLAVKMIAR